MKPPRTVYFDESGYTGTDLLNPDQPYFTVASADLDDHEARTILYQSFPDYKGKEFKSARMYHRPKSRARPRGVLPAIGADPRSRTRLYL